MGATYVTVTIRNPAEPSRSWEGLFLVDTGATDSLAPRRRLEAIGLAAKGQRVYETTDGREVKMDVTTGDVEFLGDFTAGRIIMGADDAEPLLGVTALESAGIEVDPVNQRLKKLPALRLKNLRRARTDGNHGTRTTEGAGGAACRLTGTPEDAKRRRAGRRRKNAG